MPALSPTMTDGIINQWLVKVGDIVKAGDIIAEIETDKATMEVEAVDEGKITHILEDTANKQIPVNSVIAIIDGDESESIENKKKIENTSEDKKDEEIEKPKQFLDAKISQNSKSQNSDDRLKASPLVKKIAKESNLDLSKFNGTGPDGRIIKRDIDSNNVVEDIQNTSFDGEISIPSTMRKVIAKRTLEAKQQIPHFYLTVESNVDKLINLRKKINENNSIKVSFNDLIVKAISLAMKKNPNTNVYWQNDKIYKLNDIDVSVAVAIDEGLITPII